ncbi:Aurora kinase C-like isoform X2 [Aphelenchoides bicaudatus]|nr:Aurora kinase C-like isoform X2 [Aphelenchoides bicaudatus]
MDMDSSGLSSSLNDFGCTRRKDGKDWDLNHFEVGKRLGNGRFGSVYLARETSSEFVVALKILFKSEISSSIQYQVQREVAIQFHLHHKNILRLFGYFHDKKRIYLILEYAPGGSLYSLLQKKKLFSSALSANLISQLVSALSYLHSHGVIHRDIKPENMLLCGEILKLADFGWSAQTCSSQMKTYCGTPDYLAPEMLQKGVPYSFEIDIWAVGVTLFEFLTGRAPFESRPGSGSNRTLYTNVAACRFRFPSNMPAGSVELIKKILVANPASRPSLQQIQDNAWIKEHKGLADASEFKHSG